MTSAASPTATVVVCSRDRPEMLDRLLSGLRDRAPGAEVLVVDSASRDRRTREVSAEHGVRCLRSEMPGLSIARNLGIREATSDVVVFTDDDCVVRDRWFDPLVEQFSDPRVGAVTGVMAAPSTLDRGSAQPGPPRRATGTVHGLDLGHGANMAFRRAAVLEAGGFDERLGAGTRWGGAEDLDMFCRLLHLGWAAVHVPSSFLWHMNERTGTDRTRLVGAYARGTGAMVGKWLRIDPTVGARIAQVTARRAVRRALAARGGSAELAEACAHLTGLVAGAVAGAGSPLDGHCYRPASRTASFRTTFLRPVEERFLRQAPGAPPQVTTSVHTVDGAGLRGPDGSVDAELVRQLWDRAAAAAPVLRTRLVVPAHRLLPPAWVPTPQVPAEAIRVVDDVPPQRVDHVLSSLETAPLDPRVSPIHVVALDHTDGTVTVVGRATHAWTDGAGGLTILGSVFRTEPEDPPWDVPPGMPGPRGGLSLTAHALRTGWRRRRTPGTGGAVLTGARARRVLGRVKWAMLSMVVARTPVAPRGVRRLDLSFTDVTSAARRNGGGALDLLTVATARASGAADAERPGGPVEVRISLASGQGGETAGGNRVRVVHVAVDPAAPMSAAVPAVRVERKAGRLHPVRPPRLHATLMVGPRADLFFGRSRVRAWTLLPSLASDEELSVLGLVNGKRLTVSLTTRFPERLPVYEEELRRVLGGTTA